MNVLFISAVFPYPLHSGGQVRIYNLLRQLSRTHDIHLVSYIRTEEEKSYAAKIPFCKKVTTIMRGRAWQPRHIVRSACTPSSFLFSTYGSVPAVKTVSEILHSQSYDIVHIEPGYAWSLPAGTDVPVVVSEHNIEHEIYGQYVRQFPFKPLRPLLNLDVEKMKRNERDVWKNATCITGVSEIDCMYIQKNTEVSDVTVVPNGVDASYFPFKPKKTTDRSQPVCLYVGTFDWMQNVDAVRYILTDIWKDVVTLMPEAHLRIVGRNPPESLKNHPLRNVTFLEHVDDIRTEYNNADMLLAPIRIGGGTKYKILESMSCGLPVLTTTAGAMGLDVHAGRELWIADTKVAIIRAVSDILTTPKREKLVSSARKFVESKYSWEHISGILDGVWRHAYESKKR